MGLELIKAEDQDKYLEYNRALETPTNKWAFNRVNFFVKIPGEDGWDHIKYFYGLKTELTDYGTV